MRTISFFYSTTLAHKHLKKQLHQSQGILQIILTSIFILWEHKVFSSSYSNGMLYCSLRRKVAVSTENSNYMLDLSENQYAIWASGNVNNGLPAFHSIYFGSSIDTIDIRFEPIVVSLHRVKLFPNVALWIPYFFVFEQVRRVTGSCRLSARGVFKALSNM